MNYYLGPNFGNNVIWRCKYSSLTEEDQTNAEKQSLIFDLLLTEGAEHLMKEQDKIPQIPDLLIWSEPAFIKNIVNSSTDFILGSDLFINTILSHSCMPYIKYKVVLKKTSGEKIGGYSLVVFKNKLSEVTIFSETSIQISSLLNPAEGEVVKGYCSDLNDFNQKMNHLISSEQKMIRFKEFAIEGKHDVYGFGRNGVLVTEDFAKNFDSDKFIGCQILKSNDISVANTELA